MTSVTPIIYTCCDEQHVAYLHPGAMACGMQIDLLEVFEPGAMLYRVFAVRDATLREGAAFVHMQGLFAFLPDGKLKWVISTEEVHPFYGSLELARAGLQLMRSHPAKFNDLIPDSIFVLA